MVTIKVIDSGNGFADCDLNCIFNRYETNHSVENREGSGIGLSIVKEMMDILNGKITIERNKGRKGATVSLQFRVRAIECETKDQEIVPENAIQTVLF